MIFVDDDKFVNPVGAKGLGEIGLVFGAAVAVAEAVIHATRIRDLPITTGKLVTASL